MGLFLLLLLSLFIRIIHVYTPFTSGAPLSGYQQWRIHDIYNLEKMIKVYTLMNILKGKAYKLHKWSCF